MSNLNAISTTGTTTITKAAAQDNLWFLTSVQVSQAGPTQGPNAKLTVWQGSVGGTRLFEAHLGIPEGLGGTMPSVGIIQDIPLPKDANGKVGIQAAKGTAMIVQVVGTGDNQVSLNCRIQDGLP